MVNTYFNFQKNVMDVLRGNAGSFGVQANNITFGGKPTAVPAIHVLVYPVKTAVSRQALEFPFTLECYCFVQGKPSEQKALNEAYLLALNVLNVVNPLFGVKVFNGMEVAQFLQDGKIVYTDRCCLVLNWDVNCIYGDDGYEG